MPKPPVFTCSVCKDQIKDEYGNNAWPLNNGRCCDYCNAMRVIPARLLGLKKPKAATSEE